MHPYVFLSAQLLLPSMENWFVSNTTTKNILSQLNMGTDQSSGHAMSIELEQHQINRATWMAAWGMASTLAAAGPGWTIGVMFRSVI